ncbi:MAG: phosphoglycerate kinase [Gammaproteobacteria bacterium RIFCSPLOWO2_02_FULL_42_14]|nr:MAG: phosphoglycerate kinase [Gammaproteobacteria bacterium RIFCSPHIGHO2_02_FULL_42_43]OGT28467.1 MAG: phosphoglycerate kinase [Gammaproteobacteria bacterium RIFCSPHIGHO2_01_FULL_42_8]OGT52780.1 MAG: phosphoglycerate kinase [Gammaproteobacteria bacterium RIFCSPHIGHO2_12_FULL_41_25]OGT63315.1 MAG: phosphoglycerate kinase [Gammaproteobacteria bacterium RIFCSPLOWO2_02_FULL_42_14]OGT86903.1 MAG: phosphoglycerate kinase [Gammaproteobacteria bacterium RIFCSPLOWO2_12_FULL_42_18]
MPYLKMSECDLKNRRVLIREDFNVPMKDGVITDDARIRAAIPTIEYALKQNAAVILISHLGRPTEVISVSDQGKQIMSAENALLTLAPIAKRLSELLQKPVKFIFDWINGCEIKPGEILLCENVRFLIGEKKCDEALSKKMAALCDIFVMDAFATAHRRECSTVGVVEFSKKSCAGLLLDAELQALTKAFTHPVKPLIAIVGGSKVSTKMSVLDSLLDKVNTLIVGGGIANTFLAADNVVIGKSLIELDWIAPAKKLLEKARDKKVFIPLPVDVAVAKNFSSDEKAVIKSVHAIKSDDMILDVGPKTAAAYEKIMHDAKTIVWNGPVGVFEFPAFAAGTKALGQAIADSSAFSLAGGGDTLAAIAQFHLENKISYLSTGGGAFLEFIEGKTLPAVAALEKQAFSYNQ